MKILLGSMKTCILLSVSDNTDNVWAASQWKSAFHSAINIHSLFNLRVSLMFPCLFSSRLIVCRSCSPSRCMFTITVKINKRHHIPRNSEILLRSYCTTLLSVCSTVFTEAFFHQWKTKKKKAQKEKLFHFCHSRPKMQTGRRSHTNKNKLCTATRYPALCIMLLPSFLWEEKNSCRGNFAGCLATKQMEKGGLGDSYFPDD